MTAAPGGNEDAGSLLARAHAARAAGDRSQALALFAAARDAQPSRAELHADLAAALLEARRLRDAIAAADAALAIDAGLAAARRTRAAAHFAAGEVAAARADYDALLAREPRDAPALAGRGDCRRMVGDGAGAIADHEAALAIAPDLAHSHANLGPLLLDAGRLDDALAHCRRAAVLLPGDAQPWLNLGLCLVEAERLDEAMDAFAEAEQRTASAHVACAIARAWERSGDLVQAQLWVDQAEAREPGRPGNRVAAGSVLIAMGEAEAARATLEALCESEPGLVEAWLLLGRARWDDGDVEAAVAAYERALAIEPRLARVHVAIGEARASAGDTDAALAAYRTALAGNPRSVAARCGVVQMLKSRSAAEDVAALSALLANPGVGPLARASVHAALAQHADATARYGDAVAHLGRANALQWESRSRRDWQYDPVEFARQVDAIIATFDAAHFARVAGWGDRSSLPVFVVGMPRSGTTLTEQILASHPALLGVGERTFALRNIAELPALEGGGSGDPLALVGEVGRERVAERAADWLAQLGALAARAGRPVTGIVDKLPDNYLWLGWIATVFPNARIVHVRRDPRDIAVSCWITAFAQIPWACDLDHIAERLVQKERLVAHWRRVLPLPIHELDYESLVAEPEAEVRRLLAALELPFDPGCLDFHRRAGVVRTASVLQVRQPIYGRSVARWRHYEQALEPLTRRLRESGLLPEDR